LYIPAGRRRRRAIVIAVAALVVGVVVGWALGRSTAVTPADAARDARERAGVATSQLTSSEIHYAQVVQGEGDTTELRASVEASLDRAAADLSDALARASWIDEGAADDLRRAVAEVRDAERATAPIDDYNAAIDRAERAINERFGKAVPPSTPSESSATSAPS
jgi:hypothetical protein